MLSTFLEKLNHEMILKGLSISVQKRNQRAIKMLAEYHTPCALDKLTDDQIKAYLVYLVSKEQVSSFTYNKNIYAFRFFYENVLNRTLSRKAFSNMKQPKSMPDILSIAEVEKIINATINLKYKTMFILAYGSGLRIAEIAKLKTRDIDSERMLIHVRRGKKLKDRYTILPPVALKALRAYWKQCRSKIKCRNDWLFPGRNSESTISDRSISLVFQDSKRKSGITKAGGIHSFRHAFATHLMENGESLYTIKELLGHSLLETTTHYLHLTEKRRLAVDSPISKLRI